MKNILAVLILTVASASAVLVPPEYVAPWTPGVTVGVQGGIPTGRTPVVNVTGADPTGVNNSADAINAAIAGAAANSVVFLPAGTYKCDSPIFLKNDMTLRGAGMNLTNIVASAAVTGTQFITRAKNSNFYYDMTDAPVVTAGKTKGSTVVTVPSGTTDFVVGQQCQITRKINATTSDGQFDIPIVFKPVSQTGGFAWVWTQKSLIVSKTATTVTIVPGIIGHGWEDYEVHIAPGFWHPTVAQAGGIGLEDFHVDMTPNEGVSKAIFLEEQHNSWLLRVKVTAANNYSLDLMDCVFVEVRECYFGGLDHGGTNGAGILVGGCSGLLIENNIVLNSFPTIEVNTSTGNVIAYNFMFNVTPLNGYFSMNANHNAHTSHNLYEGNVANNIVNDGFHGSGSTDTIYRNWFHRIDHWYALARKRFTREYLIIGNIFGRIGGELEVVDNGIQRGGEPNIGNSDTNGGTAPPWPQWGTPAGTGGFQELDIGVDPSTIFKHNFYFFGNAVPVAEQVADPLVNSLYLSSKPAWFGNLPWPPNNPYNNNVTWNPSAPGLDWNKWTVPLQRIPAGYRYINGVNPPPDGGDITPPTPNPMTFASAPAAASTSSITMTASTASDAGGGIQYWFEETSGNPGGTDSGWQPATVYVDTGLTPSTQYTYQVKARDASLNETSLSSPANATTTAAPPGGISTINVQNLRVGP
jgi:hypothetical protein